MVEKKLPELHPNVTEPSVEGQETGKQRFLEAAKKATPEQRALFIEAARRDPLYDRLEKNSEE